MEPICGVGRLLDGSFATLLPTAADGEVAKMAKLENPWKRTYSLVEQQAIWQGPDQADGYCDKIRASPPFDEPSKLLDLIDLHVFDFLIGRSNTGQQRRIPTSVDVIECRRRLSLFSSRTSKFVGGIK
jgi:glycosaminoglycan xylosylkinase